MSAPVTNSLTGEQISSTNFLAQLYYGLEGTPEQALVAVTNPPAHFESGSLAGYILPSSGGGERNVATVAQIPTSGAGRLLGLRGWNVVPVPEPRAGGLALLGGAILFLLTKRARRKAACLEVAYPESKT